MRTEDLGLFAFCAAVLLALGMLWHADSRGFGGRAPDSVASEPTAPAPQAGPSSRGAGGLRRAGELVVEAAAAAALERAGELVDDAATAAAAAGGDCTDAVEWGPDVPLGALANWDIVLLRRAGAALHACAESGGFGGAGTLASTLAKVDAELERRRR